MIFFNLLSRYNSRHSNGISTKNKDFVHTKGITLVALVVTIVVLLILAGITITMLFGENGIIKKAQDAAEATKNDQDTTSQGLANLENAMNEALNENGGGSGNTVVPGKLVSTTTTYTDSTGTATIPGGFCVVTGENNTVEKGLVISDAEGDDMANTKEGNQFVWVPVPDVSAMYGRRYENTPTAPKYGKLYDFSTSEISPNNWTETDRVMTITSATSYREPDVVTDDNTASNYTNAGITDKNGTAIKTASKFRQLLQQEFDDMIASVEKYDGFYIGRYETGDLDKTNAVVKKNNSNICNVNWYTMYQKSKGILSEENQKNATTSMIWGCQFDRTLQWLVESGDKTYAQLKDSSSWGNYNDYSSTTGDTSTASGGGNPQPTGTNEAWQANHIYDLAGNIFEWTIEAYDTNNRVLRGGYCSDYGSTNSVSKRITYSIFPSNVYVARWSCHTLYILNCKST